MSRVKRSLISLVLVMALLCTICTVRPAPVYASSSETTAIVLVSVVVGLMIVAVVVTLIVRNNPAWMPALPQGDGTLTANPWERPDDRIRFGLRCGIRDGGVPLFCW